MIISLFCLFPLHSNQQLLETSVASEKMHKLDEHVAVAVAGINSDANILINNAR